MNEPYIQTIRGGIQRVSHLAEDHWTKEPERRGFNHHHGPYGHIPVCKPSKPVREARNKTREEHAWPCHVNRHLAPEQMAARTPERESHAKSSMTPYETFRQKPRMESLHTVTKAFVGVDGFEYRAF